MFTGMKSKPLLDNWAVYHDILVGEIYGDPKHKRGERVYTLKVQYYPSSSDVVCADGEYRLGKPGNLEMYKTPPQENKIQVFMRRLFK
jgi:hypothetical protein